MEHQKILNEANDSKFVSRTNEGTNFNNNIANTDNFKSFKYKAKLLENTDAQPAPNEANGILKNVTVAVSLKYLTNSWRSLECY